MQGPTRNAITVANSDTQMIGMPQARQADDRREPKAISSYGKPTAGRAEVKCY
ncbi:hypothetical protein ACLKA7_005249, partial [Drosophila subpalustris]